MIRVNVAKGIWTPLQYELKEAANNADRAMHVLVTVRKLLDLDGEHKTFSNLRFYCDWAVHQKLDRNPSALAFLRSLDAPRDYLLDILNHHVLYFEDFREEFKTLLKRYDCDLTLVDSDGYWTCFTRTFCYLVADCPIEPRDTTSLSHITRVVIEFKGGDAIWRIRAKDGSVSWVLVWYYGCYEDLEPGFGWDVRNYWFEHPQED
jgi:hypothetical protein